MTKSILVAASLLVITLAQPHPAAHAAQGAPVTSSTVQYRYLETPRGKKPRVVITADPELDDNNSVIRYILVSDGYKTEGLIYASSQFHWTGDGTGKTLNVPGREYNRNGLNLCPCTFVGGVPAAGAAGAGARGRGAGLRQPKSHLVWMNRTSSRTISTGYNRPL